MYSLSKFSVTHDELNGGKSVSTSTPCQINWCYTVCKRSETEVDEMGMGMLCNGGYSEVSSQKISAIHRLIAVNIIRG